MKTAQQQKLATGWNESQVRTWHDQVTAAGKVRDYSCIVARVNALPANTHYVETYATMSDANPAFRITVGDVHNGKPNILITGGVHGYEPSGVEAALQFTQKYAPTLTKEFNFVTYPCISSWAYEHDQRWNAQAEDPNRLFTQTEKSAPSGIHRTFDIEECRHFMTSMESETIRFSCAIDLHETCDRDIELRVLRSERFKEDLSEDYQDIPQGYYLILSKRDTAGQNGAQLLFGQSIIDQVRKVSPIAPEETILNGKINYGGVILSPPSDGLMRTYLDRYAGLVAVTEVYPDHKTMSSAKSVQAQIASINGVLNYVRGLTR